MKNKRVLCKESNNTGTSPGKQRNPLLEVSSMKVYLSPECAAYLNTMSYRLSYGGDGSPSILAWRIPWTEEPSGLLFMESQRVRHDWVTKHTDFLKPVHMNWQILSNFHGLPWWLSGKESTCNAGDVGWIPELGRCNGEGNGRNPGFLLGISHGQRSLVGCHP